ncbi:MULTISPECIES: Rrf2 family transcriptional regulator [unclassified Saccharopolyspora]|uniref:Rrf2 family transcriptional regulator n=1 Tax=unclassified Saccharopolyspora TaxID=2646250 RepID=UPI001CD79863|nr:MULTISPECIES: Rrf2 family transcriptional regulator [unclassified Saccharopolyspora]MCA1187153.1 Rrf2 family transcriptional regulator [Saccharopolyspora sp. 6T]MCA1193739.1 Rrf2 family transcriptional regulator [Saccharopolyspora sp. 6V]
MTRSWVPETASRGHVVVLHGRGEHPGLYERFGRRLAVDGYTVVVPDLGTGPADWFDGAGDTARILVGTDTGALRAWETALETEVDGLVLAGTPLAAAPGAPAGREDEIAARTSCPIHRERLSADPDFHWGELDAGTAEPPQRLPDVPVLLLHGDADAIAPVDPVTRLGAAHPQASTAVFKDGVHDVLNDKVHRSVAARIVLFCEEIAKGAVVLPEVAATRSTRVRRAAPVHISARVDYSVRALVELASSGRQQTCESMARTQGIPLNSLVNLMVELRRGGLVHSQRGCEGGYWPARDAAEITLADVVRVVEGAVTSRHDDAERDAVWTRLGGAVADFLERITIADLAAEQRAAA